MGVAAGMLRGRSHLVEPGEIAVLCRGWSRSRTYFERAAYSDG